MKKIASLLLLVFVLLSCTEDIKRNDPAFEAYKDDIRWMAVSAYAELAANQSITITGLTQFESVVLKVQSTAPGTYSLGVNELNKASYIHTRDGDALEYTTGTEIGDGEITINEYDPLTMRISGEFRFNAELVGDEPGVGPVMNFQHGFFYNVPVVPAL
jgi:hypothetical protein